MTKTETRSPRLPNDAGSPDTVAGVQQIIKAIYAGGVAHRTLELTLAPALRIRLEHFPIRLAHTLRR